MPVYYVSDTPQEGSGDHEVHEKGCRWLKKAKRTTFLGSHPDCKPAVDAAKQRYPKTANGCAECSPGCNTG